MSGDGQFVSPVAIPACCDRLFYPPDRLQEVVDHTYETAEFLVEEKRVGNDWAPVLGRAFFFVIQDQLILVLDGQPAFIPIHFNSLPGFKAEGRCTGIDGPNSAGGELERDRKVVKWVAG